MCFERFIIFYVYFCGIFLKVVNFYWIVKPITITNMLQMLWDVFNMCVWMKCYDFPFFDSMIFVTIQVIVSLFIFYETWKLRLQL